MADEKEVQVTPEKEEMSEVTVHLDEKNQPIKPAETPKDEPRYVTAEQLQQALEASIKKATAPLYYEMRKQREPAQPAIQPKPQVEPTEWDTKLQKDWKGTVEELAEARVEALLKRREAEQAATFERQKSYQLLEDNKKQVMSRHPDLSDESTVKNKVYSEILQARPEYLSNPFGPVLAMRDMEDKLREMGQLDTPTKQAVDKEVMRQVRTNGASIPKGTSTAGTKSITLTKEQKEFCDANGLKYESYVKYSKTPKNEGVEA